MSPAFLPLFPGFSHRPHVNTICMRANPASFNPFEPTKRPFHPSPPPRIQTPYPTPIPDSTTPPPPSIPTNNHDDLPERDETDTTPVPHRRIKSLLTWQPLQTRLAANPRLPLQLIVELTVGGVSKTLAELHDRKERFWQEIEQYGCNLSLELFGDAMLVWLLSPVALNKVGNSLPKHLFQVGGFTVTQRATGFLVKGLQFGVVGFVSCAIGLVATRGFVKAKGGDVEKLPKVVPNCLAWGAFMMASSNARYQLVNGFEQRVLEKVLPGGVLGAGVTFAVRFGNCYLGGLQWLPWARFWGVQ